jgi:DNA gyrase subunit A
LLTICENGHGKRTPFGPNTADDVADGEESAAEEPAAPEPTPAESAEAAEGEGTPDRSAMRYRKQRRGGKGLRDIRTSERNGLVVGIASVRDTNDIMLITFQGMVNRTKVSEIRTVGRNTQGVRVMNLNEGDRIVSVAKVASEEVEETEAAGEAQTPAPEAPPPTETPSE